MKENLFNLRPNRPLLFLNFKKLLNETTLDPGNWKFDASSNTNYNQISVPEITDSVVQDYGVLAYITFDNTLYEALPDVLDGSTLICRYQTGLFFVELQNADGSVASPPTGSIGLKIVLLKSQVNQD